MILLELNDIEQENNARVMIQAFFPEEKIVTQMPENGEEEPKLTVCVRIISDGAAGDGEEEEKTASLIRLYIHGEKARQGAEFAWEGTESAAGRKSVRNCLKRMMYRGFRELTKRELPWGTLTGVRPTKIVYSLLLEERTEEEIAEYLFREYYVSGRKSRLAVRVARNEMRLLKETDCEKGYSLYAGIPFCPTTCLYCSFTSYPLHSWKDRVDSYVEAMIRELRFIAGLMKDKRPDTFYMGGGTPTTLEPEQMDKVLACLEENYDLSGLKEYTVEAGRPDSITREKLMVLKKHGVNRISINPQTMNEDTLRLIGRQHSAGQVREAYYLARECGFENINMDLIVGLPGEDEEAVRRTMEEIKRLSPDSLTVHSLAIKRASRLNILREEYKDYSRINTDDIINMTADYAAAMGMEPYYLYRQKNMAGNFENVGYARPGKEGLYNVLIMEEKQTILAAGAGASTKVVFPEENRIERIENVKDVRTYIENIDEMIDRKRRFFYG